VPTFGHKLGAGVPAGGEAPADTAKVLAQRGVISTVATRGRSADWDNSMLPFESFDDSISTLHWHSESMNPVEFVSNTLFYRVEDGRVVFRPWGSRGPCYLVTARQRIVRARIQLMYYLAMIVGVAVGMDRVSTISFVTVCVPAALAGNYLLYWLFSQGLAKSAAPPKPSPEYSRARVKAMSRSLGKPFVWLMLLIAVLFGLVGIVMGVAGGDLGLLLSGAFFCVCAAVFIWMLKHS
jgi:hypothetical protein